METLVELVQLVRSRRRYWLVPAMTMTIVIGLLLVAAQGTVIAPFIYAIF